jgi:exopolysaccharide biosynthesis polyprenyl glycosylphosphotransferase
MDFFNALYRLKIIRLVKNWKLLNFILGFLDILAIALAFQTAYYINYYWEGTFFLYDKISLYLFIAILPFWLLTLYLLKVTEIPRTKRYSVLFIEYMQSTAVVLSLLILIYFIFKLYSISRLFLIEISLFGFLFLFIVRIAEYKIFKVYREKGYNYVNVVLIADHTSVGFIESLLFYKEWGYRIFAIFTESQVLKKRYEKTIILLPQNFLKVLYDLMEVDLIDEVLYVKDKIDPAEVRELARSCEELGITFRLRYKETKLNLTNAVKTNIGNDMFLTFINIPHNVYALAIKKLMDINISLLIIILLFPVFLIIGLLIKLTSKGPIIYKQNRVGLRGRHFKLYKFRTMVVNADFKRSELESKNEMDGPVFKIKEDPRITWIGKYLRKTGLDELPQLFNVLKGEMSLIGPRPPLQSETLQYKRWQLRRLSVKPGLSCFWQIKPDRNNIKFETWMEMDLAYIDNWSLRLDFMILLKTIKTVFQRTGM